MRILSVFLASIIPVAFTNAQFTKAIEDNSFFIEEAYNQEEGIVQHIFTGTGGSGFPSNDISFTQEWPFLTQTHQLSYTIPYFVYNNFDGIGDILLNYRYQLVNENGIAVAPRFSLILPTGDETRGLGDGVVGMQFNMPVSKRWNNEFINHFNAGLTFLPNVRIDTREENITTYFAGVSGIFLASPHFNVMTEVLYSYSNGSGEIILNPGIRYAVDIGSVQIVPGLAIPIYFYSSGRGESGIFLYLSFEHPL